MSLRKSKTVSPQDGPPAQRHAPVDTARIRVGIFCPAANTGIFPVARTGPSAVVVNPCAFERGGEYPGGLRGKLGAIANLFSLLAGPIRPKEEVVLEHILVDLYADHGIREEPRSHRLPPPTFTELIGRLRDLSPANRYANDLMHRIGHWEDNPLAASVAGSQQVVGAGSDLQIFGISTREGTFLTCAVLEGFPRFLRPLVLYGNVDLLRVFPAAADIIDRHGPDIQPEEAGIRFADLDPGKEKVAL